MTTPLVYIIAGEPSGDRLGARLIGALKKATGDQIEVVGVGGPEMTKQGLTSLFPMADLTVMGLAEVLPRIPHLLRRIGETVKHIEKKSPDVVVTIDAPDFSLRVAKKIRNQKVPIVHYVAPSVWAWKPGRAKKMADLFDHLLTLLPFEPPYFTSEGLASTFVGHPVIESGADKGDGLGFRAQHGIAEDTRVLCVLPGSRHSEIGFLLPIICEVILRLDQENLRIVLPTVETVATEVERVVSEWPCDVVVVSGEKAKYDAFAAANAAIAASGTVALELALARVPYVTIYKFNAITAFIGRRLVKTRFVNLINILLKREAVPELIQEECREDFILEHISKLLAVGETAAEQTASFDEAIGQLQDGKVAPSDKAAKVVLDVIAQHAKLKQVI